MKKILVATTNQGKLAEIQNIFFTYAPKVQLVSLKDFKSPPNVIESGETYLENALIKAKAYSAWSGLPALADDSGLEVRALHGAPGVISARYAGDGASDLQNIEKVLTLLKNTPEDHRQAKFVAQVILYLPDHSYHVGQGELHGTITLKPEGENGFGYDPVFKVAGENQTLAAFSSARKNAISHRRKALEDLFNNLKIQNLEIL